MEQIKIEIVDTIIYIYIPQTNNKTMEKMRLLSKL